MQNITLTTMYDLDRYHVTKMITISKLQTKKATISFSAIFQSRNNIFALNFVHG